MSAASRGTPSLSIVIPAFNEESRLPRLFDAIGSGAEEAAVRAGFGFLEAVIVDDGSSDRTPEILARAAERDARIRPLLGNGENSGKGAAVAAGVREARAEFSLLADVDLSTPLSDLEQLGAAVRRGADLAIGSRVLPGSVVENAPLRRKHLGKVFNLFVRRITGLPIRDTQCGFKLMATETARELLAEQITAGFAFDVELLLRAHRAGLRIVEVPVTYVHDSRSQVRVASASVRMLRDVVQLSRRLPQEPRAEPERASGRAAADHPD